MTRRLLCLLLVLGALALAACGDDEGDSTASTPAAAAGTTPAETTTTAAPAASGGGKAAPGCTEGGGGPSAKTLPCPTQVVSKGDTASVTFETSEGSFTVDLDTERAPITANDMAYLAQEGFYDGTTFHRVVPGFVIQGGDPNGDGTGGPGFSVEEAPPSDLAYTKGIVAMAKGGAEPAGTSGSQFFVVVGDDVGLPPEYALAGKVSKGMATVEKIAALGQEGADGPPTREVTIKQATLKKG